MSDCARADLSVHQMAIRLECSTLLDNCFILLSFLILSQLIKIGSDYLLSIECARFLLYQTEDGSR